MSTNYSQDASTVMAESIGANTTNDEPNYGENLSPEVVFRNRDANQFLGTPIRSNSPPRLLDDIDGSSVGSQNSNNNTFGNQAYVTLYKGIDQSAGKYYGRIGEAPILSPLPIHRDLTATEAANLSEELLAHHKFELNVLCRGPGGYGYWVQARFDGELPQVYNQVRTYCDEEGSFYYKFLLDTATNDDDPDTHPVEMGNLRRAMNVDREPSVPIRTITQPIHRPGPFSSVPVLGRVQQNIQMYNQLSTNTRPGVTTRSATRDAISRSTLNATTNNTRSVLHDQEAGTVPLPSGARVHATAPMAAGTAGGGTTGGRQAYGRHSVAAGGSAPTMGGIGVPRVPQPSSTSYRYNPMRGGDYGDAPPTPPSPSGPASVSGYQSNGLPQSGSIFVTKAATPRYYLTVLTLRDVYDFYRQIKNHDMHYSDPRLHHPVSQCIYADVLRIILQDVTAEELAAMPKEDIWNLLRRWVLPARPNAMLAALQSKDVLCFRKSKPYDVADPASRLLYLMDIRTYLSDCAMFFNFITENMTQEQIKQNFPPMRVPRNKANGLIEIVLSKIPGARSNADHNYARATYQDPQYEQDFAYAMSNQTPLHLAFPHFVRTLSHLMSHGINTFHDNLEESLKYDRQYASYSVMPTSTPADAKLAAKQAEYDAAKKALKIGTKGSSSQLNQLTTTVSEPAKEEEDLPLVYTDPRFANFNHLVDFCHECEMVLSAMREDEKEPVRRDLSQYLTPANEYMVRRKVEASRQGNQEDATALSKIPMICLRHFRGNNCKNANCKYSHKWPDVFTFCEFIQADYKRQKAQRGPGGNHPAKKPLTEPAKLQQHYSESEEEEEDQPDSNDHEDTDRSGSSSFQYVEDSDSDYD